MIALPGPVQYFLLKIFYFLQTAPSSSQATDRTHHHRRAAASHTSAAAANNAHEVLAARLRPTARRGRGIGLSRR